MATSRCRTCGEPIRDAAKFCANCGEARPERSEPIESEQSQPPAEVTQAHDIVVLTKRIHRVESMLDGMNERLRVLERPDHIGAPASSPVARHVVRDVVTTPVAERQPVTPPSPDPAKPAMPPARPQRERPTFVPAPEPRRRSGADVEALIGGRGLAWIGGLAMLIGAVFFLSLAFSRGWIGPELRVVVGVVVSMLMIVGGGWFFARKEATFGHVLVAVGLGILSLSIFAATRLYDLIPIGLGLAGVLIGSLGAAVIAIRSNVQVVAAYGIVAALAAPPMLGAEPNGVVIAFLTAVLIGSTVIALYRSWRWLPGIAFVLAGLQLLWWVADDPIGDSGTSTVALLAAIGGFWLLNSVAAGGEEFRIRRRRLSMLSATLLTANAGLAVGLCWLTLDHYGHGGFGAFLFVLATAQAAIGVYFLRAEGTHHPFGMFSFGTGVAILTMGITTQFGGATVPMAWATEAAALIWLHTRFQNRFAAFASAILAGLAVGHFITFEYSTGRLRAYRGGEVPFANAAGATLAYFLVVLLVAAWASRSSLVRRIALVLGSALLTYSLGFELGGVSLVAAWAAVALGVVAIDRSLSVCDVAKERTATIESNSLSSTAELASFGPVSVAATAWLLAAGHALSIAFRPAFDATHPAWFNHARGTPFTDRGSFGVVIAVAAGVACSMFGTSPTSRATWRIGAIWLVAALLMNQLTVPAAIIGWTALAVVPFLLAERERAAERAYFAVTIALNTIAVVFALTEVAPPSRLYVRATEKIDHVFLWSPATLVLLALATGSVFYYRRLPEWRSRRWLAIAAGGLGVYLLSNGIVDRFQGRVGGGAALEAIQRQAQVALSILWTVLGVSVFVRGIVRHHLDVRVVGLALIGLATAKVFIFDLSTLSTSYRVLSFVGLGVLLMVASYVYQRLAGSERDGEDPTDRDDRPRPPAVHGPARA